MADDEIQGAATDNIAKWREGQRNVQVDFRAMNEQGRIADELTRIRYEMTAIRKLLQDWKKEGA